MGSPFLLNATSGRSVNPVSVALKGYSGSDHFHISAVTTLGFSYPDPYSHLLTGLPAPVAAPASRGLGGMEQLVLVCESQPCACLPSSCLVTSCW